MSIRPVPAPEEAGDQAHDFLFDHGQRLGRIIDLPKFDLLGPRREPFLEERQMFVPLQGDDPSGSLEVLGRHLRRETLTSLKRFARLLRDTERRDDHAAEDAREVLKGQG